MKLVENHNYQPNMDAPGPGVLVGYFLPEKFYFNSKISIENFLAKSTKFGRSIVNRTSFIRLQNNLSSPNDTILKKRNNWQQLLTILSYFVTNPIHDERQVN